MCRGLGETRLTSARDICSVVPWRSVPNREQQITRTGEARRETKGPTRECSFADMSWILSFTDADSYLSEAVRPKRTAPLRKVANRRAFEWSRMNWSGSVPFASMLERSRMGLRSASLIDSPQSATPCVAV